ncbi:hypothetical protein LguiA_035382 [Lonicera macranthoides]
MDDEVVLLDFCPSMFCARIKIALAEKGVKYDCKEQDLLGNMKSQMLVELNPVLKKVPILIHNGKAVCESLIIVEYIDEVWSDKAPLLPSDPYQRSQAKFWANFIDKKIWSSGRKLWRTNGEKLEEAKIEFIESLKPLEGNLGDNKPYFGGETFGFLDIAFVPFYCWFYVYETFGNFTIEPHCPMLIE